MLTLSIESNDREAGNLPFSLGTDRSHPCPGTIQAGNADSPRQCWVCRSHPALPSRPGTGKPGTLNRHPAALHPSAPGAR